MAKISTLFPISGSLGDVTFYTVNGKTYARMKTSLDKRRFYSDKAYSVLPMMRVKNFGRASRLASQVYRTIPRDSRKRTYFNQLTRLAHEWLWKAMAEEEVLVRLKEQLAKMMAPKEEEQPEPIGAEVNAASLPQGIEDKPAAATEADYPPLDLPERTTGLSKWWVFAQGGLYQPLVVNKEWCHQMLQPLRPGWGRTYPRRE